MPMTCHTAAKPRIDEEVGRDGTADETGRGCCEIAESEESRKEDDPQGEGSTDQGEDLQALQEVRQEALVTPTATAFCRSHPGLAVFTGWSCGHRCSQVGRRSRWQDVMSPYPKPGLPPQAAHGERGSSWDVSRSRDGCRDRRRTRQVRKAGAAGTRARSGERAVGRRI